VDDVILEEGMVGVFMPEFDLDASIADYLASGDGRD
jgi:hypothetical protein